MSTPRSSFLVFLVCALSAVLVFSPGCEPDRPLPPGGEPLPPGGKDPQGGDDGGTDGGVLVVRSDGGSFAAKPTCTSGGACAGACPDGGVICSGNCGFLAPVQYPFAGDPKAIALGDVDKDGDDDLVTANNDGKAVAVLLNKRNGLFQTPSLWSSGREPTALALADVNEDGSLDLLVANNSGDASLAVYRGKGTGDFLAPITTGSVGLDLNDLVVDEFGGNVWSLAVLRGSDQKLSVIPLKSDGTPQTPVDYDSSSGAYALVAADFNGDGKKDLALTHESACGTSSSTPCQSVGVLLGKGDGTFQPQVFTSTGGSPRGLVAAQLDIDTAMDLIVADASRNQVLVLRGQNNGRFYEPVAYPTVKAPSRLVLADVNRDTVPDILVTSATGNQVGLLVGQPGGTFSSQVPLTAWPQDVGLQGLSASDFDGDSVVDMAVLTRNGIQMLWGICR
ncbi:VCBS repeat protein [Archangium gephyra]|uniref:Aggregation factor core protein MAFp3 n=1 Tax=Archangium gephyra TaxID=48 RepID=A0AAC8Q1C4_9BACT|nr:VCBS repeat-containing protein [Archangium gephyra]AKI99179.1 putative aggregation factor core protein MAFp3 [Archangium gephyra]REG31084.1 VCBS repeat protein [Archangium gephyra]